MTYRRPHSVIFLRGNGGERFLPGICRVAASRPTTSDCSDTRLVAERAAISSSTCSHWPPSDAACCSTEVLKAFKAHTRSVKDDLSALAYSIICHYAIARLRGISSCASALDFVRSTCGSLGTSASIFPIAGCSPLPFDRKFNHRVAVIDLPAADGILNLELILLRWLDFATNGERAAKHGRSGAQVFALSAVPIQEVPRMPHQFERSNAPLGRSPTSSIRRGLSYGRRVATWLMDDSHSDMADIKLSDAWKVCRFRKTECLAKNGTI
jgi:hypothetical protein